MRPVRSLVPVSVGRRLVLLLAGTASIFSAAPAWGVTDRTEIRRTFQLRSQPTPRILVDNVNGSIEVVGENRRDVELVAVRITDARSPEMLARANEEVRLEMDSDSSSVDLYVDGPFRCNDDCQGRRKKWWHGSDGKYTVTFEFKLRVPRRADLELQTVNDGEILVRGVDGAHDLENVNGGIEMLEVGGSSRAQTVNGAVSATFTASPKDSCFFGSVNGDLDVTFPDGLSADVRAKTFNGEIYSAFDTTPLPPQSAVAEREGRGTKYRIGRGGFRIGRGGPVLEFDAFNGDVRIRRR